MTVGLGSGSTAHWFIVTMGEMIRDGFECRCVPTSKRTEKLARESGIQLHSLNEVDSIDIAVDGADEITHQLQVMKGGGGALLQEKMVADAARFFVIIADESKLVDNLGSRALPVEVIPYGWRQVQRKVETYGGKNVVLRRNGQEIFVTDHGHYILDCDFGEIIYPATLHSKLNNIPGVVENGLFLNMADMALIGHADGTITEFVRESSG